MTLYLILFPVDPTKNHCVSSRNFQYLHIGMHSGERTKAHWDKSPLDNTPLDKSPLLNLAGWTKAHFFEKNRLKSFIKLLTLIRLLLQSKSHLQCIFTDIITSPVCCDKQLNLGVKSH